MTVRKFFSIALLLVSLVVSNPRSLFAQDEKRGAPSLWEKSIVTIEVNRHQYDYYQPWSKRTKRLQKVGTVMPDHQILSTADEMFDRTLIRVQKNGRGRWWIGEVAWIDYPANLALITVSDPAFWEDLKPASFGGGIPADGGMQICRWRGGNLETRRAEFTQFVVREEQLSAINQVVLEAGSEIQNTGWGEPLVANSKLIGLIRAQDGRTCIATPASCIRSILDARKNGQYHGLGFFHFYWQPAENTDSLAWLKLPGEPRGVVVIDVPDRPDTGEQVIKLHDILLKIDGFDLDIQGDYEDPEFGHLLLENLATRRKWAGDDVKIQICREGKIMDVTYRLPKFEYDNSLVPTATYDQEPEYLMVGGLVFQPLTDSYLQSWGAEWKRRAPFRLNYYNNENPSKDRPALVILSQVLPDAYNIGYQDQRYLVINKVDGQRVNRLPELRDALQKSQNGFHVIEFAQGETLQRMVLEAGDSEKEATTRILKRYGISEPFHFANETKN
jgi:hypothetical protein